jgi:hypothetical protein
LSQNQLLAFYPTTSILPNNNLQEIIMEGT